MNHVKPKENNKHILTIYYQQRLVSTVDLEQYNKEVITLGRNSHNDIVLNSPIVSGYHATISREGDGWVIKDRGSTNGILLNDEYEETKYLEDGDNIKIDDKNNPNSEGILMVFSIATKDDEQKWVEFTLKDHDEVGFGRDSQNHICLNHNTISRKHARIIRQGSDYVLEDLKSTNGTFVNGQQISKSTLKLNDVIFIGNTKIIYQGDKLLYNVLLNGVRIEAITIGKTIREKKSLFSKAQKKKLLDSITIKVQPGELVALVGGSGAGKSTFMDALNGFRRATEGEVLINGDDFYKNYNAYKSIIGYVPQEDIVYDNLTVQEMLGYAAQLRMSKDTTKEERDKRVSKVIGDVELEGKENVTIKNLSGGQRKRVSIAVELLADPKLFFLDEPTSGLDPGMERNMMKLLKKLSNSGKTIILITHATANLHLCDKVLFLGRGGKLCYFGPPGGVLDFFKVEDYADVYNLISEQPEHWEAAFKKSNYYIGIKALDGSTAAFQNHRKVKSHGSTKQLGVLVRRYTKLMVKDTQRLIFLLVQAPLIAVLLGLVSKSSLPEGSDINSVFEMFESSKKILFTLACSGVWIGVLNSIQEVCKERTVFRRERAVNLGLMPYLSSKLLVLGFVCAIQSILMILTLDLIVPLPESLVLIKDIKLEMMISTFLVIFSSTSMGLLISTFVKNNDRAMGIAPIILIPQIMLSGFVFDLEGAMEIISNLAISRWGSTLYAISIDYNTIIENTLSKPPGIVPKEIYTHSLDKLYFNYAILGGFVAICTILSFIILKAKDKEK